MMMMMMMMILMKGFWGMVDQQEYFNPIFVKKMELIKVSLYMTTYSRVRSSKEKFEQNLKEDQENFGKMKQTCQLAF